MCSLSGQFTTCMGDIRKEEEFSPVDWTLLRLRADLNTPITSVCSNHALHLISFYSARQLKCCDPLPKENGGHPDSEYKASLEVRMRMWNSLGARYPKIVPGRKLCYRCYNNCTKEMREIENSLLETEEDKIEANSPEVVALVGTPVPNVEVPIGSQAATPTDTPFGSGQDSLPNITTVKSTSNGSGSDPSFSTPPAVIRDQFELLSDYLKVKGLQIDRPRLKEIGYCIEMFKKICGVLKLSFETSLGKHFVTEEDLFLEMISQLKSKFEEDSPKLIKIHVLSVLPKSLTRKWITEKFNLPSDSMPRLVKRLVKEKEILPSPAPKLGHGYSQEELQVIQKYYEGDSNSVYMLPDKSHYFSVKIGNEKVRMQKRLLLCNLKELHGAFLKEHPQIPISFSKFASLRPRYCVFAGSPGTHTVCVCEQHQNVKLKLEGSKLAQTTRDDEHPLEDYKACLKLLKCFPISHLCALEQCPECPGDDESLREIIELAFDVEGFEEVI